MKKLVHILLPLLFLFVFQIACTEDTIVEDNSSQTIAEEEGSNEEVIDTNGGTVSRIELTAPLIFF